MMKLAFNVLLQGKPVGTYDLGGPCYFGGFVRVAGTVSSNATQGTTDVDLTYAFAECKHVEVDSDPDENYELTVTGTFTQKGIFAVQPTSTSAVKIQSDSVSVQGYVNSPPLDLRFEGCPVEFGQDGNKLTGFMCGRLIGVDL